MSQRSLRQVQLFILFKQLIYFAIRITPRKNEGSYIFLSCDQLQFWIFRISAAICFDRQKVIHQQAIYLNLNSSRKSKWPNLFSALYSGKSHWKNHAALCLACLFATYYNVRYARCWTKICTEVLRCQQSKHIHAVLICFISISRTLVFHNHSQGDCREETRRAYKIPISALNGPFGQPGR